MLFERSNMTNDDGHRGETSSLSVNDDVMSSYAKDVQLAIPMET